MTRPLEITISGSSNEDVPIPENPPEGIVVTDPRRKMALDGGGILLIFVAHITSVPFAILGHWLYDTYFKARPLRGSANRRVAYVSRSDGKAVESL
jgi:hypothetical protein